MGEPRDLLRREFSRGAAGRAATAGVACHHDQRPA